MRMHRTVSVALAVGVLSAWPIQAWACADFYESATPPPPPKPKPTPEEGMSIAEAAMQKEEPSVAARALAESMPHLRTASMDAPTRELRALRILAIALARTDGALTVPGRFFANTAALRGQNIEWSIATLRLLNQRRPNDPVLESELGEALAHAPVHHAEAESILSSLATRDLMGSAHAYAELARLRILKGDAAASREAALRCQAMTKTPSVCPRAPDPTPLPKVAQTGV
jgi:hypothetical protein